MYSPALIVTFACRSWSDGQKYVLIDPELYTPEVSAVLMAQRKIGLIKEYNVMASYGRAIEWIKYFSHSIACIVVISNRDLGDDMQKIRPDLEIRKIELKPEAMTNE